MSKSLAELAQVKINALAEDETVVEILWQDEWCNKYVEVYSDVINTSRWKERILTVYKFVDHSLLGIEHDQGLTEIQEGTPENAKAYLVEPYKVQVTKYRKVANE